MERIIKMSFQNSRNIIPPTAPLPSQKRGNVRTTLRSPMIERIHTTKSGCSACGRKVA